MEAFSYKHNEENAQQGVREGILWSFSALLLTNQAWTKRPSLCELCVIKIIFPFNFRWKYQKRNLSYKHEHLKTLQLDMSVWNSQSWTQWEALGKYFYKLHVAFIKISKICKIFSLSLKYQQYLLRTPQAWSWEWRCL